MEALYRRWPSNNDATRCDRRRCGLAAAAIVHSEINNVHH